MRVRSAIKKLCEHCRIVKKGKKNYVKCKADPRHKQRQGFSTIYASALRTPMSLQYIPQIEVTITNKLYTEACVRTLLFSNRILPNK